MDGVGGASALLPVWLRSGAGLPLVALAFLAGLLGTWLAVRLSMPGGHDPTRHWTERARHALPARCIASLGPLYFGLCLGLFTAWRAGPLALLPPAALGIAAGLAAWLGASWASARLESRVLGEPRPMLRHAYGQMARIVVLVPGVPVIGAMALFVRGSPDPGNLAWAAAGVAAYAASCVIGGVPLAGLLGVARPPSPRLLAAVERAAVRTGIRPRSVRELDLPMANALAMPVPRWLVFTRRCVERLDDAQLEAIAAHELGHLSESRGVVATRLAGAASLLPFGFTGALVHGLGTMEGLAVVYGLFLCVVVPVGRLRRRMEQRADAVAHRHESEPGAFAIALERLYEINLTPAVGLGRTTHPHLYDRMAAAGAAPGWPRPAAPSRLRLGLGIALAGLALAAAVLLFSTGPRQAERLVPDPADRGLLGVALTGGSFQDVWDLAQARRAQPEAAFAFLDAIASVHPRNHAVLAFRAELLAGLRRCREATAALEASRASLVDWPEHRSQCPWIRRAAGAVARCGATPATD